MRKMRKTVFALLQGLEILICENVNFRERVEREWMWDVPCEEEGRSVSRRATSQEMRLAVRCKDGEMGIQGGGGGGERESAGDGG